MQEASAESAKLSVSFFGGFEISDGITTLSKSQVRSKQVFLLLEYLIFNRNSGFEPDKLFNSLWQNEKSDNPAGALKNLIYRLRNTLKCFESGDKQFIVSRRGVYEWNNEIPIDVDVEKFEKLYILAENSEADTNSRIRFYMQAIELYRGDFLAGDFYIDLITPIYVYYKNMFLDCVKKCYSLLVIKNMFSNAEAITTKAISIDPFEEDIQILKLRILILQEKYSQALEHYEYVTSLYYRELGVKPSQKMNSIYKSITKQIKTVETDLDVIKEELCESFEDKNGAFYCDYEVFKNIYRIEVRGAERKEYPSALCLFTLKYDATEIPKQFREKCMDVLRDALVFSLRRGDVVCRLSATQYLALLPTINDVKCEVVLKRIHRQYDKYNRVKAVKIHSKSRQVDTFIDNNKIREKRLGV